MGDIQVDAGSALAQTIQAAAQAKLMENGWAPEENDTTLSEYVTMMLVNGKDMQGVQSELGGELLGVGEDDPQVAEFTRWLFDQARSLSGHSAAVPVLVDAGMEGAPMSTTEGADALSIMDEQMGDAAVDGAYVQTALFPPKRGLTLSRPSGPKAMRNGSEPTRGRGRRGRMLGQMNRSMDRAQDDPLRRIKGAASGAGRVDGHANRAPRGPRGQGAASGIQRAMNGGGGARGGHNMQQAMNNPMMNQMPQDQQMMFMQMMEMQANMMANMMQNGGQSPATPTNGMGGGGAHRGRGGKSMFDRIDKRGGGTHRGGRHTTTQDGDDTASSGMDIDRPLEPERTTSNPFDTMCKFNHKCLNPDCPFAHQSPANTRPGISLDMSDTCPFGPACQNTKCLSRHPSPAQRSGGATAASAMGAASGAKSEVVCRFYPNCSAGAQCPFKHPDQRACRNGADCSVDGCPFAHSRIACRYNPCTRRECPYKHAEGQRRGVFADKVWTAEGDGSAGAQEAMGGGKSGRFAGLAEEAGGEELILPGQQEGLPQNGVHGGQGMAMENTPLSTDAETPRAFRERVSASAARKARDAARVDALQRSLLAYSAGAETDEMEVLCIGPSKLIKA
ncbi:oxygen-dependent protoporphyrinogen oxidase [Friedmanniomyces endolithicus]|uniref:Oxygen-dependent protoporphyrinogen oxidase n=1 Tax=Friedmanniomyces endolithicus TaxID=329885 RepID=A0AAN6KFJ2_9PEZI|nr:oxygen-dependent protoporphyrinogen oxidase [Friedmanniomyces endolithicus]KAK0807063.1 oxygen-dependent protoporphyrinogen oxidase [Friedmanniomyces endolithicus]KAK0818481.1 oxygen-dependent protoporphyrinogen oxidase [Friedmanniomyces endolithicus]KAK0821013.1 oxygen-dependent protoporphyrinogen oxidase [Friedmanniomyces endolithicus]KAK0850702.1 oxygen-dependent protoporphyrinogen oxidase [Friedmanniomyces endolithicus]